MQPNIVGNFYTDRFNQIPKQQEVKIVVSPADVNLNFYNARTMGKSYKIEFIVNLYGPKYINYNVRNLDFNSLKQSILQKIPTQDKDYLKLEKFDDRKAVFTFNDEKWFSEAVRNIKKSYIPGAFNSKFKFNKQIPRVIAYDIIRSGFNAYITKKFEEYMTRNKIAQKNLLFSIIPNNLKEKFSGKLNSLFTYSYNYSENAIIAEMKTEYVLMFSLAVSEMSKNSNKSIVGINFNQRVKGNMLKPLAGSFASKGILGGR